MCILNAQCYKPEYKRLHFEKNQYGFQIPLKKFSDFKHQGNWTSQITLVIVRA